MSNICNKTKHYFKCKYCDTCFKSVMELELHDKNIHLKIKCPSCVRLFRTDKQLQIHVEANHYVHCQFCVKSFGSFEEMESHDRIVHLAIECPYCDKLFRSDEQLQKHIEYKHKFQCEFCDKHFSSIEKLDHHDKYVHLTIECLVCDKLFFRNDNDLLTHIKSKHPNFKCTLCYKWFHSEEHHNNHWQKVHKFIF